MPRKLTLMSLNLWGGAVRDPLLQFIHAQKNVDIFCLQEVYCKAPRKFADDDQVVSLDIFSEIAALLPTHEGFFSPVVEDWYGIALFVKKDILVLEHKTVMIHHNPDYPGHGPTHSRILQSVTCRTNEQKFYISNVHGLWNGMGKTDSPHRIAQSQKIREFMEAVEKPHIVCGDFNLRPDTESLQLISRGMTDLIQHHNIQSTRTVLYEKDEKFADYIFTSSAIKVDHFEVREEVVSDHAPLYLEFFLS